MKRIFFWLPVLLWIVSCDSSRRPDEEAFLDSLESMNLAEPEMSEEVIESIMQQVPSPLEITFLLKETGSAYNNDILNSTENVSKYNSNFSKALNLGVYGTDLGYTNIYNQNQDALFRLNAIKELAEDLSIGQFFDFGTIRRLATNSSNLDSLLLITTQNFNQINTYLQEQKRSSLSVLLLTGGWMEALHILCQVAQNSPENEELIEKIGEQKIIYDNIKLLLDFYRKTDPNISDLYVELVKLDKDFEQIQINHTYGEPSFEEVDGMLVIKDNSTTTIDITSQNVESIRGTTASLRNKLIN